MSDKTNISKKAKSEQLATMDTNMLVGSLKVLDGVLGFADIDADAEDPPDEWLRQYGTKEAHRRFRLAKAGWESSRNLPSGVKIATTLVTEIMKAKAMQQVEERYRTLKQPRVDKPRATDIDVDIEKFGEVNVDE